MTEEPDGFDDGPDDDEEGETFEEYYRAQRNAALQQQPDPLLDVLNHVVTNLDMTVGVTLHVGGSIVTGQLAGAAKWLGELSRFIDDSTEEGHPGRGFASAFRELELEIQVESVAPEEDNKNPSRFIHLTDAIVVTSPSSTTSLGLWRVRLAAVDGWTLGTLTVG